MADIAPEVLAALNNGTRATATLVEGLALDDAALLRAVAPDMPAALHQQMAEAKAQGAGVVQRMQLGGRLLWQGFGPDAWMRYHAHPSDTVRGWTAYALMHHPDLDLAARLGHLRPLADDAHFGVREWAWLAVRPAIVAHPAEAVRILTPWTADASANLRRFASEATRPRGVWCAHIAELKAEPWRGLGLLAPLRADPARYVQDSVGNWLNDAAKTQPAWVREVTARWLAETDAAATRYIVKRGLRSVQAT